MSLRFLFLSDSHEGGFPQKACLHPRYVGEQFDQLWQGLGQWVDEHDIAFVIHGGDIIDSGWKRQIQKAVQRTKDNLRAPMYLCLGNHDLARTESMDYWLQFHDGLLPDGQTDYGWKQGPAAFYVLGLHWHPTANMYWEQGTGERPTPRLDASQITALEQFLIQHKDRPVIVISHAPVEAVQPAQTGKAEPWHPPHPPYRDALYELANKYDNLRLILSGHNHATNQAIYDGWAACNNAAFNESPAQVRIIEVTSSSLTVDTLALAPEIGLPAPTNELNLWGIQAGPEHRVTIGW